MRNRICKLCGKQFQTNTRSSFCSEKCKEVKKFIPTLIKYFGLHKSLIGSAQVYEEINKIKETLYNLYWNQGKTSSEICKIFNYPNLGNLTGKVFKYLEIPSKSCKITNKEQWYKRKSSTFNKTPYKQGWYTTWNNKEVFLRSSYEKDYAKKLDSLKIEYEVETLRIPYFDSIKETERCAIPDFYIPSLNEIVEIKSAWTLNIQNMKDRFAAYKKAGYNVKLILNKKETDLYSLNEKDLRKKK